MTRPWYIDLVRGLGIALAILGTLAASLVGMAWVLGGASAVLFGITLVVLSVLGVGLFLWDHFK